MNAIVPIPKFDVTVRQATLADLPFVDSLQKMHSKMVGWMPEKALIGKIEAGHVLVARASRPCPSTLATGETPVLQEEPVGYVIGQDQYFKRDDCGIVYQMNVAPDRQRGLIGATLLKALFDRAAYGCKLFCCWCAQDIDANYFWESMGFVPLAFRAGSRDKGRVHIFWQRRIRAGDNETPYWFPSQTTSGAIREDRLVFPIPPGMHWKDEMPRVLPEFQRALPEKVDRKRKVPTMIQPNTLAMGRLRFGPLPAEIAKTAAKTKREKQPKAKNDPKYIAAARELRDRWLERVNADPSSLLACGKYDVSKAIASTKVQVPPALPVFPTPLAA